MASESFKTDGDIIPREKLLHYVQAVVRSSLTELGYAQDLIRYLEEPQRILKVKIPVKLDQTGTRVFTGYRVQYNDAPGPTKGGVLFHPDIEVDKLQAMSMWNGIKSSVLNLPFGGAKGGIICDPRELSFREMEGLARGYIREISPIIGPDKDIPAMDASSNSQVMAWMMDEFSRIHPEGLSTFFTGKPLIFGGLAKRDSAIADGITVVVKEAARLKKINLNHAQIIIQGFGSAGSLIAKSLSRSGIRIVGISDAYGGLYAPEGLDIDELLDSRDSFGTVTKLFEQTITNQELLEKPCDLLILAAIENQITDKNEENIKAKIVIEGTGRAVSEHAAESMTARDILLVPEILAGAGDVAVSYLEWVQHLQGNIWTNEEVDRRFHQIIGAAFQSVAETAEERNMTMRRAAYLNGIQRLAEKVRFRGWI
ncbi:Glu/Leu/Phe/Val family dehydrogenase [Sporolactobacillus shoreae]|uniref:Glu/Leu/Phe/Val family dehydrogenase n=1 Tax=Sporolactobacillus shoreae TaxID=1465501 RepID=UPI001F4F58F8|nr:Glu/Leu/Phe/Val dehydrogenase [Sporolactobacillus shoreae]